jgi:hypothetical protein
MPRLRPLAVLAGIALLGLGMSACSDISGPEKAPSFCQVGPGSGTCDDPH